MLGHLYSGQAFFSALGLVALLAGLDLSGATERSPLLQSAVRVIVLLALAVAALSGTPVALWLAVPGVAVALAWLLLPRSATRWRIVAIVATIVTAVVAAGREARFHVGNPYLEAPLRIVVIGDSLSSGGFGEERAWSELVCDELGAELVNLARPGDTVGAALEGQVPDIPLPAAADLVVLEIGGNDMLEGRSAAEFARLLEMLCGDVTRDGRQAIMFELPLLPGRWGYGVAQRNAARAHGIALVPKRVLSAVLLDPENTTDGLHLTQHGHEALAEEVMRWAGWPGARRSERETRK